MYTSDAHLSEHGTFSFPLQLQSQINEFGETVYPQTNLNFLLRADFKQTGIYTGNMTITFSKCDKELDSKDYIYRILDEEEVFLLVGGIPVGGYINGVDICGNINEDIPVPES